MLSDYLIILALISKCCKTSLNTYYLEFSQFFKMSFPREKGGILFDLSKNVLEWMQYHQTSLILMNGQEDIYLIVHMVIQVCMLLYRCKGTHEQEARPGRPWSGSAGPTRLLPNFLSAGSGTY